MAARPRSGSNRPLVDQAGALLRAGDIAGYRALWAAAGAEADRNARYIARRALIDAAVAAHLEERREVRELMPAIDLAAAEEQIAALEEEPAEPVLLNQAGVFLTLLGSYGAAQALLEAAQRLDPELPNVASNLREVAQRRAQQRLRRTPDLARGLADRALAVARRARPADGMRLSLCMIVKDEEEMLPRCLAAAAPAVDEIVVVDTGSSDRTIEIARSFGARVIEREWTGDFGAARNVGMDAATGEWLLILDADEVLVSEDVPALRALLGQTWREAFYVSEINYTGDLDDGTATTHNTVRVIRNRPEHRYRGRLHEQIVEALPSGLPERFATVPVRIEHFGYLGAVRDAKEKSRRNVELLQRQIEDGDDTPFLHFNLGSEYAAAGDSAAALAEFERAAELLADEEARGAAIGYLPAFTSRYVRALKACGRNEDAIARAEEALERFPGFTDLVYEQAAAARVLGRTDEAVAYLERCLEMGDAPARFTATVGTGTYLPTIALAEILLQRGDAARAAAMLDECLGEHPGFFGLVHPLATALLADGAAPDAVVRRVESRVAKLTPTVRFMLGTALYERGETEAAERQYRALLEQQPGSGHARVALAEALLSQSRWADAAAEAAALPDAELHAGAARRSELFARLAGGDLDGADAVIARLAAAAEAGDPVIAAHEVTLFRAWHAAARGVREHDVLPLEVVDLLAVTLEALLRVEEVDAFGTLVGLLDRCPIPPREQRELRAGMYLRRGFLASAAEEWIAAVSADPADQRALVGLAHVALGQGMSDEALDFAREAHALDPGDARATRLLEALEPTTA